MGSCTRLYLARSDLACLQLSYTSYLRVPTPRTRKYPTIGGTGNAGNHSTEFECWRCLAKKAKRRNSERTISQRRHVQFEFFFQHNLLFLVTFFFQIHNRVPTGGASRSSMCRRFHVSIGHVYVCGALRPSGPCCSNCIS